MRIERQSGECPNIFRYPEWCVLGLYCAILAWLIPHHEPWADEAQAWLLVNSASPAALFGHLLRYEGTPGLWHLLLIGLLRLHGNFAAMHWMAAGLGLAGVLVWLRWAPLPRPIRWMMPFTFFLQFQFAVIARNYVLFPVLAFALCAEVRRLRSRPIVFALLAGLMANVSLHGALFSLGIACVYVGGFRLRTSAGQGIEPPPRPRLALATVLLGAFWIAVPLQARIPPDHDGVAGLLGRPAVLHLLGRQTPAPVRDPAWFRSMMAEDAAHATGRPPVENADQPQPPPREDWSQDALDELLLFGSLFTYPVSNWNVVALPFVLLTVTWVLRARQIVTLLPWALIFALCLVARAGEYHTGLLWLALVSALWLTWPRPTDPPPAPRLVWLDRGLPALLVVVLAIQVGWTVCAAWKDTLEPYSAEKALAAFLRPYIQIQPGAAVDSIAGFHYQTIGANVYFTHPVYANQSTPYWLWPISADVDRHADRTLQRSPRFVVVALFGPGQESLLNQWVQTASPAMVDRWNVIELANRYGYRETHRFCGGLFMRFGVAENQCEVVMERPDPEAVKR